MTLRSSGRVTVTGLNWSDDVVRAQAPGDVEIMVEAERIARVEMIGGRWAWLLRSAEGARDWISTGAIASG